MTAAPIHTGGAFVWSRDDREKAAAIASALYVAQHHEEALSLLESSTELLNLPGMPGRAPRELDAWRFFLAARTLPPSCSTLAAWAREIGARVALELTGRIFTDAKFFRFGTSCRVLFYDPQNRAWASLGGDS